MVSQSGAILVHLIGPCNPQAARSFDRLRMKSKEARSFDRLRMMVGVYDDGWGAQSFDRLRMMVGGLRMKGEELRMMVGGQE